MNSIFQSKQLLEYRRSNRNALTPAETLLWKHLRRKQLLGFRFRRQYSAGNFILDFYCPKARLGIELDGGHHGQLQQVASDDARTRYLESLNIRVIRFWNSEVIYRLPEVLQTVETVLFERKKELG